MKFLKLSALFISLYVLSSCSSNSSEQEASAALDTIKIVSLNGTVSEILVGLGLEKNIVGIDVTSTYPESLHTKTKVGHNRNISVEGVLALQPDVIVALKSELKPEFAEQFKAAGIRIIAFEQEYTAEGAKRLIHEVSDSLKVLPGKADSIVNKLTKELGQVPAAQAAIPKVLFIYARGAGTMMVAGEDTQIEKIIKMAGGENAVKGFKDFKPLTAESLVKANPDILLLFDSGLESLGGTDGLLKVQGIPQTKAGKNKKVISMDGQLLTGFGPRLGEAVTELSKKIH